MTAKSEHYARLKYSAAMYTKNDGLNGAVLPGDSRELHWFDRDRGDLGPIATLAVRSEPTLNAILSGDRLPAIIIYPGEEVELETLQPYGLKKLTVIDQHG